MKFLNFFEDNKDKTINLYVDMDGVLAEYDIGNFDYSTIRPMTSIIKKIETLNKLENVNVKVLSICKTNKIVEEKYIWFKKHADFFNEDQLIFLSKEKEENNGISSKELKCNYLVNNKVNGNVTVLVDDDNEIISHIRKNTTDIVLFQISSLVD